MNVRGFWLAAGVRAVLLFLVPALLVLFLVRPPASPLHQYGMYFAAGLFALLVFVTSSTMRRLAARRRMAAAAPTAPVEPDNVIRLKR